MACKPGYELKEAQSSVQKAGSSLEGWEVGVEVLIRFTWVRSTNRCMSVPRARKSLPSPPGDPRT